MPRWPTEKLSYTATEARCSHCKTWKLRSAFQTSNDRKRGVQRWCKECCRERYRANPSRTNNRRLLNVYGLSEAEVGKMAEEQGGACAICKVVPEISLCVDHDKVTGLVRGLLCASCNLFIGQAGHDEKRLAAGIRYLQEAAVSEQRSGALRVVSKPIGRQRGAAHPQARLTEADVVEARRAFKEGRKTQRQLAAEHGISFPGMSAAIKGRTWKHVPQEIAA